MTEAEDDAWNEGYEAWLAEKPLGTQPYDDRKLAASWCKGWFYASEYAKDNESDGE